MPEVITRPHARHGRLESPLCPDPRDSQWRAALAALQDAEAQARSLGMVHLGFEAALVQAEIAARQHRADADARLAAVVKDARTRGFGSIAARGSALRTPPKT